MSTRRTPAAPADRKPAVNAAKEPRTIEPNDYAAMIERLLRAMGRRAGEADCESLRIFPALRDAIDRAEHHAIAALLAEGYSYADMGRALGVSKVAVHKRYNNSLDQWETPQ